MPTEGFFQRWSRLKTEPVPLAPVTDDRPHELVRPAAGEPMPVTGAQAGPAAREGQGEGQDEDALVRQPTLDDVAQLRADSDYSVFVARGVDKSVHRSALKKLFADPHFNTGDGLDLYMGDYNKADPIPPAMMSALRHTQSFFAQAYPDEETDVKGDMRVGDMRVGDMRVGDMRVGDMRVGDMHDKQADDLPADDPRATGLADPASTIVPTNPELQMADATGAASEDKA